MARRSRKNAVELSGHQDEIEDLLSDENNSLRFISDYIKAEYGLDISYGALNNHKKSRMNVVRDAAIQYSNKKSQEAKIIQSGKRSKKKHEYKVKKAVSDLEKLDEIIDDSFSVNVDIDRLVGNPDCDQVKVEGLKLRKRQQGINAIAAKNNILKQADSGNFEETLASGFVELSNAIKKSREATKES